MNRFKTIKLFLITILFLGLVACGGGGSTPATTTGSTGISGGGVKGPLANAIVTVFAFDDLYGLFLGCGHYLPTG